MITRNAKTSVELEDAMIADAIRSMVSVKARQFHRNLLNETLPAALREADDIRNGGGRVDITKLLSAVVTESL